MLPENIQLEIVTPERLVAKDTVTEIQIPGTSGYLGILPGHAPLITEVSAGEIRYVSGQKTRHISVGWGFAEVLPDKVTILAEVAEHAEEIDVARAQAAKERAEEELKKAGPEGHAEAEAALKRAIARLDVAAKK